jgi:hypothetical protein
MRHQSFSLFPYPSMLSEVLLNFNMSKSFVRVATYNKVFNTHNNKHKQ